MRPLKKIALKQFQPGIATLLSGDANNFSASTMASPIIVVNYNARIEVSKFDTL